MTAPKTLDFYFDLSSPYSYLAVTQVPQLAARTGARVNYKPFPLFAIFKATGNEMPARVPAKAAYMLKDLERWARHYGVPFRFSSHFPVNTLKAMRLVVVGEQQGKAADVALSAFFAMWAEDQNLEDPKVLLEVARAAGLDPEAALAAIETQEVKDRVRANSDEAIARGVFGAPAFFVGEELFWGNDRLQFVEAALRR
jgi:2-hydroxychromene-2-carboxylate isomerase